MNVNVSTEALGNATDLTLGGTAGASEDKRYIYANTVANPAADADGVVLAG